MEHLPFSIVAQAPGRDKVALQRIVAGLCRSFRLDPTACSAELGKGGVCVARSATMQEARKLGQGVIESGADFNILDQNGILLAEGVATASPPSPTTGLSATGLPAQANAPALRTAIGIPAAPLPTLPTAATKIPGVQRGGALDVDAKRGSNPDLALNKPRRPMRLTDVIDADELDVTALVTLDGKLSKDVDKPPPGVNPFAPPASTTGSHAPLPAVATPPAHAAVSATNEFNMPDEAPLELAMEVPTRRSKVPGHVADGGQSTDQSVSESLRPKSNPALPAMSASRVPRTQTPAPTLGYEAKSPFSKDAMVSYSPTGTHPSLGAGADMPRVTSTSTHRAIGRTAMRKPARSHLLLGGALSERPPLRLCLGFVIALGLGAIIPMWHARSVMESRIARQRANLSAVRAHGHLLAHLPTFRSAAQIEEDIATDKRRGASITFLLWVSISGVLGWLWFRFT